jgi:hypothetical protein
MVHLAQTLLVLLGQASTSATGLTVFKIKKTRITNLFFIFSGMLDW